VLFRSIPEADAVRIGAILNAAAGRYLAEVRANRAHYEGIYDLGPVSHGEDLLDPVANSRTVRYRTHEPKSAAVQVSLKPILSFRHARNPKKSFGRDLRETVTRWIQADLDRHGLGHYVARPGGRSTIDVTAAKLDKAYALEYLIDHLNLQGLARHGQRLGSNAIYFGDEVIVGGGNDYPVTRIPGLLVFAVNADRELVPMLSHVFVPSAIFEGPDATAQVLRLYNACAEKLQTDGGHRGMSRRRPRTALEALKQEIFTSRIREKIATQSLTDHLSVDDWQVLHAFVTIMCRDDPTARQWLSILIGELDAIMTQLAVTKPGSQRALGWSHPDR
jgi:hydroxymethylpyrimidine pyrophosphatase-like HAD family hydrolase